MLEVFAVLTCNIGNAGEIQPDDWLILNCATGCGCTHTLVKAESLHMFVSMKTYLTV